MKKLLLLLFVTFLSNSIFCQIEWVSDDYDSEYPGNLFKTMTDQFILLHGEYEGYSDKMSVFDSNGNIVYNLDADETSNTFKISGYKHIMHLPDSSVAIIIDNWYLDTASGWGGFYTSILKFDKQWNPSQVNGMAFSTEDVGGVASDGSFIVLTTGGAGVARIEPDGGWTWAEWLGTPCYDMIITQGDTIIIATEEGLLLMDINGNFIGENPSYIFKKMKIKENGDIVGINGETISIISPEYELLFDTTISLGHIEDFHLEGDTLVALTDSNHVYLLNDSLYFLHSFDLFNHGQFDFISLNNDNVILTGMERYGGEQAYHQTRSTFLKEYSLNGDDYGLSNDIGLVEVGQASSIHVSQLSPDTYRIYFKDIPLKIKNFGDKPVNNIVLRAYINSPRIITDFSIQPGEEKEFIWDEVIYPAFLENPAGDTYGLCFWTTRPDNLMDLNADNDYLCSEFLVNDEEVLFKEDVYIFPNPVNGNYIFVEADGNQLGASIMSFSLFDSIGKQIMEGPFSNTINISKFESGFYFLFFFNKSNEIVHSEKLIIQK
jgi:hypothetical protein